MDASSLSALSRPYPPVWTPLEREDADYMYRCALTLSGQPGCRDKTTISYTDTYDDDPPLPLRLRMMFEHDFGYRCPAGVKMAQEHLHRGVRWRETAVGKGVSTQKLGKVGTAGVPTEQQSEGGGVGLQSARSIGAGERSGEQMLGLSSAEEEKTRQELESVVVMAAEYKVNSAVEQLGGRVNEMSVVEIKSDSSQEKEKGEREPEGQDRDAGNKTPVKVTQECENPGSKQPSIQVEGGENLEAKWDKPVEKTAAMTAVSVVHPFPPRSVVNIPGRIPR